MLLSTALYLSCAFFLKKILDTGGGACYKLHKLEKKNPVQMLEEVIKMMEFMLTMAVIALIFIAATILVALLSGGLMKLKDAVFNRESESRSPE
jgi:hypothetical protein